MTELRTVGNDHGFVTHEADGLTMKTVVMAEEIEQLALPAEHAS